MAFYPRAGSSQLLKEKVFLQEFVFPSFGEVYVNLSISVMLTENPSFCELERPELFRKFLGSFSG